MNAEVLLLEGKHTPIQSLRAPPSVPAHLRSSRGRARERERARESKSAKDPSESLRQWLSLSGRRRAVLSPRWRRAGLPPGSAWHLAPLALPLSQRPHTTTHVLFVGREACSFLGLGWLGPQHADVESTKSPWHPQTLASLPELPGATAPLHTQVGGWLPGPAPRC